MTANNQTSSSLPLLPPEKLNALIQRALVERWDSITILGPSLPTHYLQNKCSEAENAERIFCLTETVDDLFDKICLLTYLTSLDLTGNSIREIDIEAIATSLTGLTSLNLTSNSVGNVGAKAIAVSLTGLTSLNLSDNKVGDAGAQAMANSLTSLTSLDLSLNGLGDDGAVAIAVSLTGLTSLNLSDNKVGKAGTQAIAASLTGLTSLDLGFNSVGNVGAKAIAASLTGLTSLDLRFNSVGDYGAQAIGASLTGLTSLNLELNSVGEFGAQAIAASLTGLTSLNLGFNNVGNVGAQAIAVSLTDVIYLDLNSNGVDDVGAQAIATSLTGLSSLKLWGNGVGEVGARAIAASLTDLTALSLGQNSVGDVGAQAIAISLTGLTSLDLSGNNVGDVGALAIATSLTGLTSLHLDGNDVSDVGAQAIATSLAGLTSLNLDSNSISDTGAQAIATSLTGLSALSLGYNSVGDVGVQAIAASLTGLTSLYLDGNDVSDVGAQAIAASLADLTSLYLSNNRVGDDGAREILDRWSERAYGFATHLKLEGNEISANLLTEEVLASEDAAAILSAYARYQQGRASDSLEPLNELKVLVVGNEAVGKTSLIKALVQGESRDVNERRTPGTEIHRAIDIQSWEGCSRPLKLNIWDFGGQEVMHGTHKYFLSERSLYLLILEDRREDDQSVYEWLRTITNLAGRNVPIMVVINKSDNGKSDLRLKEQTLKNEYPGIVDVYRTSCDGDEWGTESIELLRRAIADRTEHDSRLHHIRDPLPRPWKRVKTAVSAMAGEESVLPVSRFENLCTNADSDHENDAITSKDEQRALLKLLNDIGTIVASGMQDENRVALRDVTLLDPNWLTGAIYKVLNEPVVRDQDGIFNREQLGDWLNSQTYPPDRHEFILEMMQHPDIGLCFRLPDQQLESYLVPEALRPELPWHANWPDDCLRFRYRYEFLPRRLIPRFIVQTHRLHVAPPVRAHAGVILEASGCNILIEGDRDRRVIDIRVSGPEARRRSALNVVLHHFDVVHAQNLEIGAEQRVPLPDNPELDESYDHLLVLEDEEGPEYRHRPTHAQHSYTVSELLDGVRRDRVTLTKRDVRGREGELYVDRRTQEFQQAPERFLHVASQPDNHHPDTQGTAGLLDRSEPATPDDKPLMGSWRNFSIICGAVAMALAAILFALPTAKWRIIVGGIAGIGFLVTSAVLKRNPKRFYRRLLSWVIPLGLLAYAGGGAVELWASTESATGSFKWDNTNSSVFFFTWGAIIGIFVYADLKQEP